MGGSKDSPFFLWEGTVCLTRCLSHWEQPYMQQGEVQWDMTTVFTEPTLALKMFAIVAMVSLLVAGSRVLGCWIKAAHLLLRSRRSDDLSLQFFSQQAGRLNRWMAFDALIGATAANQGLLDLCRGLAGPPSIGRALLFQAVLQPMQLLLFSVSFLFLAQWHMVWLGEKLGARLRNLTI